MRFLFVLCFTLVFSTPALGDTITNNEIGIQAYSTKWGDRVRFHSIMVGQPGAVIRYWYRIRIESDKTIRTEVRKSNKPITKQIGKYGACGFSVGFSVKPNEIISGAIFTQVNNQPFQTHPIKPIKVADLFKRQPLMIIVAYQLGDYLRYQVYAPNIKAGLYTQYTLSWTTSTGIEKTARMKPNAWDFRNRNRWGHALRYGWIRLGNSSEFTFRISAKIGSTGRVVTKTFN